MVAPNGRVFLLGVGDSFEGAFIDAKSRLSPDGKQLNFEDIVDSIEEAVVGEPLWVTLADLLAAIGVGNPKVVFTRDESCPGGGFYDLNYRELDGVVVGGSVNIEHSNDDGSFKVTAKGAVISGDFNISGNKTSKKG